MLYLEIKLSLKFLKKKLKTEIYYKETKKVVKKEKNNYHNLKTLS